MFRVREFSYLNTHKNKHKQTSNVVIIDMEKSVYVEMFSPFLIQNHDQNPGFSSNPVTHVCFFSLGWAVKTTKIINLIHGSNPCLCFFSELTNLKKKRKPANPLINGADSTQVSNLFIPTTLGWSPLSSGS